jgi:hypothetical protein
MDRAMPQANNDAASYGAEALPAGFAEMSRALHSQPSAAPSGAPAQPSAPLVGLIALAAHWMKKRGSRA